MDPGCERRGRAPRGGARRRRRAVRTARLSRLRVTGQLDIGRTFTQREIDRAYLEERARTPADERAKWLYPIGDSGAEHDITAYMPPVR
jgi:hypothetical protein